MTTHPTMTTTFESAILSFSPGVNSRAELVTLAPGLRPSFAISSQPDNQQDENLDRKARPRHVIMCSLIKAGKEFLAKPCYCFTNWARTCMCAHATYCVEFVIVRFI